MGIFDNADTVTINGHEVESIIDSNGGILYEKPSQDNYVLSLSSNKDVLSYYDNESATITANLSNNNVPVQSEIVTFTGGDFTLSETTTDGHEYNQYIGTNYKVKVTSGSIYIRDTGADYGIRVDNGQLWICDDENSIPSFTIQSNDYFIIEDDMIYNSDKSDSIDLESVESMIHGNIGISNFYNTNGQVGYPCTYEIITSELEEVTDSNGECTVSYVSKGAGDINITANCMNLQETYSIEDCIDYDPCTSASGKWTIPNSVSNQYSENGWKISLTNVSYQRIQLTNKLTSDCSVEFTLMDYNITENGGSVVSYIYTNGETTPNQEILDSKSNYGYSTSYCFGTSIGHRFIKGAKYRIEFTTSTIKAYENNTLIGQINNNIGFPTKWEFHMGANGRYAQYKDIKIKPL